MVLLTLIQKSKPGPFGTRFRRNRSSVGSFKTVILPRSIIHPTNILNGLADFVRRCRHEVYCHLNRYLLRLSASDHSVNDYMTKV